MKTGNDEECF